jgi:hypothetical protein
VSPDEIVDDCALANGPDQHSFAPTCRDRILDEHWLLCGNSLYIIGEIVGRPSHTWPVILVY